MESIVEATKDAIMEQKLDETSDTISKETNDAIMEQQLGVN